MTNRTRFIINRLVDELKNVWFTREELEEFFEDLGERVTLDTIKKYVEIEQVDTEIPLLYTPDTTTKKGNPYIICCNQVYYIIHTTYFINGLKARV